MIKLQFKTLDEFDQDIENGNDELSYEIVNTVLNNIDSKDGEFQIAEVTFEEAEEILEIYVEPEDYIETLTTNLDTFIELEDYEMCGKVRDALEYLKGK